MQVQEKCSNSRFYIEVSLWNKQLNTYTQSYSCIEWKHNVFIFFFILRKVFWWSSFKRPPGEERMGSDRGTALGCCQCMLIIVLKSNKMACCFQANGNNPLLISFHIWKSRLSPLASEDSLCHSKKFIWYMKCIWKQNELLQLHLKPSWYGLLDTIF